MLCPGARGKRKVLIKQLEGIAYRQERANRDGRHDERDRDVGQDLPRVGPVDLGSSVTSVEML